MGNTPSTGSAKLRRDTSTISSPRALGNTRTPLGPEVIASPELVLSPVTNRSQTSFHSTNTLSRRASFSGSHTSLRSSERGDVRRTRSANASPGPTREDRTSQLLDAPPPYSLADPSSSSVHLPEHHGTHLTVPDVSRNAHGHRRAVSSVTPGDRNDPRLLNGSSRGEGGQSSSHSSRRSSPPKDEKKQRIVPEELGYGVGSGLSVGPGTKHAHVVMVPPGESSTHHHHTARRNGTTNSKSSSRSNSTSSAEDPLELLRKYKTIFIVDDSASMVGERWEETREALASLADTAARYGTDGIDAYFLNAKRSAQNMRSASSVKRQFDSVQPHGLSLIAEKLEELLQDYLSNLETAKQAYDRGNHHLMHHIKPVNYIIITDGVPTDDPESVIVNAAKRLDKGHFPLSQVGIEFVQVGDDPRATEALKELDEGLSKTYGIRDMVDTTPYSGGPLDSELLIKILLGGINRRVDRRGAKSVMP